jgi:hypothetical protein
MNMKDKRDLRYVDFLKLWEYMKTVTDVESQTEELTTELREIFFKSTSPSEQQLEELRLAIETDAPEQLKDNVVKVKGVTYDVNVDISKLTWGEFISLETSLEEDDTLAFLKHAFKRRHTWIDKFRKFVGFEVEELQMEDISLALAQEVLHKYKQASKDEKAYHTWTFDPPPMPVKIKEETQGDIYRKEFADHYGGYIELTYLVSNGNVLIWDDISKLPATEVLFKGEYLLRKNKVENIK